MKGISTVYSISEFLSLSDTKKLLIPLSDVYLITVKDIDILFRNSLELGLPKLVKIERRFNSRLKSISSEFLNKRLTHVAIFEDESEFRYIDDPLGFGVYENNIYEFVGNLHEAVSVMKFICDINEWRLECNE